MSYQFTQDWFQWGEKVWPQLIPHMQSRKYFLEIGSFEGRSTIWIIEHMMEDGGDITCIDTWEGGEEHSDLNMGDVEQRFDHNISTIGKQYMNRHVNKIKDTSVNALADLIKKKLTFDFIYVDGSHVAKDVLADACMAWQLLAKNGIMIFDDYLWGNPALPLHNPKIAIDAFVNTFGDQIQIMHVGYQLVIKRR